MRNLASALLILVAAFFSLASPFGPGDTPETDSCIQGLSTGTSSVSLLHRQEDRELQSNSVEVLVDGEQGFSMLPLRVSLSGPDVPSCALISFSISRCLDAQCSQVVQDGGVITQALATYSEGQARVTRAYYVILDGQAAAGDLVLLEVAVGDARGAVRLWLDYEGGFFDAGPADAGPVDAALDASLLDAHSDAVSADASIM